SLISVNMPNADSKNGNNQIVNTVERNDAATTKPVCINISLKEYFSIDRNININTVTILIKAIPIPDLIIANRSFTFTKKIIPANCEKKKYVPASTFK